MFVDFLVLVFVVYLFVLFFSGDFVRVVDIECVFLKKDQTVDTSMYEKCFKSGSFDIHPNSNGLKKIYEIIMSGF